MRINWMAKSAPQPSGVKAFGRDFDLDALVDGAARAWNKPVLEHLRACPFIARVQIELGFRRRRDGRLHLDDFAYGVGTIAATLHSPSPCGCEIWSGIDYAGGLIVPGSKYVLLAGVATIAAGHAGGRPWEEGLKRLLRALRFELTRMLAEHFDDADALTPAEEDFDAVLRHLLAELDPQQDGSGAPDPSGPRCGR